MKTNFQILTIKAVIDDAFFDDVSVHIEDMDGKTWWMGVYKKGTDKRLTFLFRSKSKISMELQEQDLPIRWIEQEVGK